MSTATETADPAAARANQLYWTSSDTVDHIADQLDISRSALYAAVIPTGAGLDCPMCGDKLVYVNRTSRAAGRATCEACEAEVQADDIGAVDDKPKPRRRSAGAEGRPGRADQWSDRVDNWKTEFAAVEPERAVLIGGAAALGVALGAVAVKLARGS